MSIDVAELRSLSRVEKLQLVEMLWDDLGESDDPIPLPGWVDDVASRRREEMRDPMVGRSHEEMWRLIDGRNE